MLLGDFKVLEIVLYPRPDLCLASFLSVNLFATLLSTFNGNTINHKHCAQFILKCQWLIGKPAQSCDVALGGAVMSYGHSAPPCYYGPVNDFKRWAKSEFLKSTTA